MYIFIHIHINVNMYMYVHICIYIYMYTHIYIHIHGQHVVILLSMVLRLEAERGPVSPADSFAGESGKQPSHCWRVSSTTQPWPS